MVAPARDAAAGDPAGVVDGALRDLGTEVAMHAWRASDVNGVALRALASLADLLTHDISILDDAAVGSSCAVGSDDVTHAMPHRMLFDERTFATFLVYWGDAAAEPLECRCCSRRRHAGRARSR